MRKSKKLHLTRETLHSLAASRDGLRQAAGDVATANTCVTVCACTITEYPRCSLKSVCDQ